MASIGEITATVRADISGYVGPMKQVAATNTQVATTVQGTGRALNRVGQTAILVAGQMGGFGGQVGSLASRLALLAGGGGIMFAVGAALAAVGYAFKRATEDTVKHKEAIEGLTSAYQEATGEMLRNAKEAALIEMATANRGRLRATGTTTTIGGVPVPMVGRFSTSEEMQTATENLAQATRALDEWLTNRHAPALRAAAAAADEAAKAHEAFFDALKAGKSKSETNLTGKGGVMGLSEEAMKAGKSNDMKDILLGNQGEAIQGAQDAANSIARAFMGAFADSEGTIMERVAGVLKRALMAAIEKIIAQEIFSSFLALITGGASKGVEVAIPIIGGMLGLGNAPAMQPAMSGGITVDLSNLPRPLSPVEYARDAMHMAVWVETSRQAQANGVNLRPRFR